MAQIHYAYANEARDPATAAMLSMIPGLGQFYNGESRKGVLFLDVALINYFLMALILLAPVLSKTMQEFAQQYGMKVNVGVLEALKQMHFGTPVSLIVFGMLLAFIGYAVRDAYDHAMVKRRRALYSDAVIELPEATSGSYIIHASLILALAVTALFFILPKPLAKQIVEIEFVNSVIKPAPKPTKSNTHSQSQSKASILHFDKTKAIQKQAPKSEVSEQDSQESRQSKSSASASSASAASAAASQKTQIRPVLPNSHATSEAKAPALNMNKSAALPLPAPRLPSVSPLLPTNPAIGSVRIADATPVMTPRALSTVSSTMPAPVLAAAGFAKASLPVPTIAPSGSLAAGSSRGPALPAAQAASGSARNAFELPSIASMPVLGGGKVSTPILPSGGSSTKGSSFAPSAPGPLDIPASGGSKIGAAVPVAMSLSDPGGRNSGKERGSGNSDTPAPFRGGKSRLGEGPLAISPSQGRPLSGAGDKPLNFPAEPGKDRVETAKDPDFSAYMADLQRRIKRAWTPSRENQSRRVKVIFKVHTGGELSNLRIVSSSGVAVVDQAALKAVEQSAPFRHLPDGAPENVDIEFTFDYNVFSGRTF